MAEIKELGESLLSRQQARNDRQYKESKREAYKIAIATAGVGLVNEHLKQKATQFMTSEPVLAQKAKYRAAVAQADRIGAMQMQIQESGKTAEEWFLENRYLPAMEAEYKAQYGAKFVPESYLPSLREKARELSAQEAANFREAVVVAQQIPDIETAMAQANSVLVPPTNAGQGLLRKVKGLFQGKTEDDFQRESLERVEQEGLFVNESVKQAFDKVSRLQGYEEAVRFVKSLDTSKFKPNQKVEVKTDILPDPGGTGLIVVHVTSTTDDKGNNIGQTVRHERIEGIVSQEEVDKLQRAVIEKADLPKLASDVLTPAGNALLVRRLNERRLNMIDIRDAEQFTSISRVFQDVMADSTNLKDDVKMQGYADMLSAGFGATEQVLLDLSSTMLEEGKTPEEVLSNIGDVMSRALDSSEFARGAQAVETPTTVYPDGTIDWYNLNN